MNEVNDRQLNQFREADWSILQVELVKYAEKKVRRMKWRSGSFLPKGHEPVDLVAMSTTKTLNAILRENKGNGFSTWNEEKNPTLLEHLKDAIDTEVANLVRSMEHKKTNYSPLTDGDEAQNIFEASVDLQQTKTSEPELSIEHENFEEFRDEVMKELEGDDDAQLLFLTYEELANSSEVVKPNEAAAKMGIGAQEVYNLVKRLRRASDRVSERMEKKYDK